eukprot:COSAG05_NODE_347_length_10963_cov_157.340943_10_plen_122_part_00
MVAALPHEQELQLEEMCADIQVGFGGPAGCVSAFGRLLSAAAGTEEATQLQAVDAEIQAQALSEAENFVSLMFKPPPGAVAKQKKAYTSGSGGAIRSAGELSAIDVCRGRFPSDAGSFLRW